MLIFCTKPSFGVGKNDVFVFFGKIQKWPFLDKFGSFLVSRRSRWRPKDSRSSVHTSVCPSVARLLENHSLLFSETFQLVRACKRDKNFPSAFLKKFPFCPFWPKTVQNWPFGWMCAMGGGEGMTQKPKFVSKIFSPYFCLKNMVSLLKIDFD